jgi:hypothetical protein
MRGLGTVPGPRITGRQYDALYACVLYACCTRVIYRYLFCI